MRLTGAVGGLTMPAHAMSSPDVNQFTEVAEVYDSLMSIVPYEWWVRYSRQLWDRHGCKPKRVLDLCCGTGSVTLELHNAGYEVEGADFSESMCRIARRKLPESVPIWCQDARSLDLPSAPFDACLCLFDSLNYLLTVDDLARAFRSIFRHLVPGGLLVFDVNTVRALETGMFDQTGTGRDSRLKFDWHSAWEPRERLCTIHMEFQVEEDGQRRVFHETHIQRGHTHTELLRAMAEGGMEFVEVYDAYTTRPVNRRSDRLYYVARKPAYRDGLL